MPKIEGGPAALNTLLEEVYSSCMKTKKNETRCSKIAWGAAEAAGWKKNKKGEWKKKSEIEMKKDAIAKKAGIKRNKNIIKE